MADTFVNKSVRIALFAMLAWFAIALVDRAAPLLPWIDAAEWSAAKTAAIKYLAGDAQSALGFSATQLGNIALLFIGAGFDDLFGLRIQNALIPPRPDFLQWPFDNDVESVRRVNKKLPSHIEAARTLGSWLAERGPGDSHGRVAVQGVFGPRGVGKTAVIAEAFRHLNRGRGRERWRCGRLIAPIRPGVRLRRPTAIYVDYREDAELFWRSFEALNNTRQRHPVVVIFESSADFEVMVAGRPMDKVNLLRRQIKELPQPRAPRRNALTDQPGAKVEGAQRTDEPMIRRTVFLQCPSNAPLDARLDDNSARRFAEAAIWRRMGMAWGRWIIFWQWRRVSAAATLLVTRADGRPAYILRFVNGCQPRELLRLHADQELSQTRIDPFHIVRDEAEFLVHEATAAFPEEGLKLALLLALAGSEGLSARMRHDFAPGSGDTLRLSRLVAAPSSKSELDLYLRLPGIPDPNTAHFVLMSVLRRLQQEDVSVLVSIARKRNAIARNLRDTLVDLINPTDVAGPFASRLGKHKRGLIPLMMLAQPRRQEDEAQDSEHWLDRCVSEVLDEVLPPQTADVERDRQRVEAGRQMRAISDLILAVTSDTQIPLVYRQGLDGEVASIAAAALDRAPSVDRRQIMSSLARISPSLAQEIGLLLEHPEWMERRGAADFVKLIFGVKELTTPDWLQRRLDDLRPSQAPEAHQEQALKALTLMDRAFQAVGTQPWTAEEEALIATLLVGDDPVGRMCAAWATFWQVRARDMSLPERLHSTVEDALWGLVKDRRTRRVIWKRAAASLAKLNLPVLQAGADDLLLTWAQWVDGDLPDRPTTLESARPAQPAQQVPVEALEWAYQLVDRPGEGSDVRRAAALFIAACAEPANRVRAIPTLAQAVSVEGQTHAENEALLLRLAQLDHPEADEALANLVRERRDGLDITAFLALAAGGKIDRLDAEDFVLHPDRDALLSAWSRLKGDQSPPAATHGWFRRKLISRRGHLVHKLKARDTTGRWAYYFVLVDPQKEANFLKAIEGDGTIDLEDYGVVIASNYGEEPSQETIEHLKQKNAFAL